MESNSEQKKVNELELEIKQLRSLLQNGEDLMDYSLLLQEIVNKSPYPMWIANKNGIMQKANKALLDTLGLDEEDLINKYSVLEDKNLETTQYNQVQDVFTKKKTATLIMSWDGKNSRIAEIRNANKVWIEASIFPIVDKNNQLTNVICQWFNITRQKEAELELSKQNQKLESIVRARTKELEEKNRKLEIASQNLAEIQSKMMESDKMASLGFLTASVVHDLNNPLNYIYSGYQQLVEILEENGSISLEEAETWLTGIEKGINNSISFIKSLNQYSRSNIEHNEMIDIHMVLDNCLLILHNKIKYEIDIIKDYCCNEMTTKGNSGQMHQLFLNILTNAIHAIKSKGKIEIRTRIIEDKILVKITDNGSGIKADLLKKVLDPFFTTKPPGEGTGLGLSISQKIISEHQGSLNIESEPGQGTTVIISLPLRK